MTFAIDTTPANLPASTATDLSKQEQQAQPEPLPLLSEDKPGANGGPSTGEAVGLANRLLATARQLGDAEMEKRILETLSEEHGLIVGEDNRSEIERQHAALGLVPPADPSGFDMRDAVRQLPDAMPIEDRGKVGEALAIASHLLAMPAKIANSVLPGALREGLRVSLLDDKGQTQHAERVRRQVEAVTGKPFAETQAAVIKAMDRLKAREPGIYEMLMENNIIASADMFVHVAQAWNRQAERAAARGRR